MIINRTRELHKQYKAPPNPFVPSIKISSIRNQIILVRSSLTQLRSALSKHSLPFTRTHVPDLLGLKVKLSQDILLLENYIKDIEGALGDPIRLYFNTILKSLVIEYRQSEEVHLNTLKKFKSDDGQLLLTINDAERVKQSIFFLTTMLMEIKHVVCSQREKIDRIEEYFDIAKVEIEKTNEELKEVPKKHNRIKNQIVYLLSMVLILMLMMAIIKAEKMRVSIK